MSVCVCVYARVHTHSRLCFDVFNSLQPWTVALQGPLSMGFSRQENWSGLPFPPPPGDLLNPGIKPAPREPPALEGGFSTAEPPGKPVK